MTEHSQVAEHYNSVPERGIEERAKCRILYQRNFNNWIKSVLIGDVVQRLKHSSPATISVLDIGCGKGGDLLKWKKAEISHLVCADIANVSLQQCRTRYEEMSERCSRERNSYPLFTAEFLVADCARIRLAPLFKNERSQKFDICSCQFALHYSFESMVKAKVMLTNITESLKPGGYFIATIPDADYIVHRLRESKKNEFGSRVFKISTELSDTAFPLFGAKYHFNLEDSVDCPEYLVYFPLLVRMLEELGMELVFSHRFPDYLQRNLLEHRNLLGRMQALEPFPPIGNSPSMGDECDYQHAKDYLRSSQLNERSGEHRVVGTLSSSEWEVVCVYIACSFRKTADKSAVKSS